MPLRPNTAPRSRFDLIEMLLLTCVIAILGAVYLTSPLARHERTRAITVNAQFAAADADGAPTVASCDRAAPHADTGMTATDSTVAAYLVPPIGRRVWYHGGCRTRLAPSAPRI